MMRDQPLVHVFDFTTGRFCYMSWGVWFALATCATAM
jgi:hypothetical protein